MPTLVEMSEEDAEMDALMSQFCQKLKSPVCDSILSKFYSIMQMTQPNVQSTVYTVTGNAGKECDPILNIIGISTG